MQWLVIENRGTCGTDLLTIVGASTSRYNVDLIGQFGSGAKYIIALCLREAVDVRYFLGKNGYEFKVDERETQDVTGRRVMIREAIMKQVAGDKRSTRPMGFDVSFGEVDWTDIGMAPRELVSNALDASMTLNGDHKGVRVELVEEPGKWARDGYTRVYLEATHEIRQWFAKLDKKFLHFAPGYDPEERVILKEEPGRLHIYRKGVLVGDWGTDSLFDYNLPEIQINECRVVYKSTARYACGHALKNAPLGVVARYLEALRDEEKLWETKEIDQSELTMANWENPEKKEKIQKNWKVAAKEVFGDNLVLCETEFAQEGVKRKGYKPLMIETDLSEALHSLGLMRSTDVLNPFEQVGREMLPLSAKHKEVAHKIWTILVELGVTQGREMPPLEGYNDLMTGGMSMRGYYDFSRDTVGINKDVLDTGYGFDYIQTLLEEYAHAVTKSKDETRDLQDYMTRIAAKLMMNNL